MSINLMILATRNITVDRTGAKDQQTYSFDLWSTPSDVTYNALSSNDTKEFYVNWIRKLDSKVEELVYAEGDTWEVNEPIGVVEHNYSLEHIKELEEWIVNRESAGYDIKWMDI